MSRAQLEAYYGIKIRDDGFYSPRTGKYVKAYKFYSADGCLWENGLRTLKAVENECIEWSKHLLDIKARVEASIKGV